MKLILHAGFVLLMQYACSGAQTNAKPAPVEQVQQMHAITLAQPKQFFPVPADSLAGRSVLMLDIVEVKNPQNLPVTIQAAFTNAARRWNIGEVTLFPSDKPGKFAMRITEMPGDVKDLKLEISLNTAYIKKPGELLIKIAKPSLVK